MTITTIQTITTDRELREKRAAEIAAILPPGDYYAFDDRLMRHDETEIVYKAASHWDACLIMLAIANRVTIMEISEFDRERMIAAVQAMGIERHDGSLTWLTEKNARDIVGVALAAVTNRK